MKKYIFVFLSVCSLLATISVQATKNSSVVVAQGTYGRETEMPFEFEVTQGWRQEFFHSKKGSKGSSKGVHIKGQGNLKNIDVYETRLRLQGSAENCFFRLDGGYGMLLSSKTTFSRFGVHSNLDITKGVTGGYEWDGKACFGGEYFFKWDKGFLNERTSISPMVGYLGGIESIHYGKSNYQKFQWHAPYVGLGFWKELSKRWDFYAEYDFACLPWKEHTTYGNIGLLSVGYFFTRDISLKAEYELSYLTDLHHKNVNASRTSSTLRLALNFAF